MKKTKSTTVLEEPTPTFSKRSFLKSEYYRGKEDILNVLLTDDKEYTTDEVDSLIKTFLKGKVK